MTALYQRRARARRMRRLHRMGSWVLAVGGALVLAVGLPWLVWRGPYLLDKGYIDTAKVGAAGGSAALVTGLRTALVACAAAIGAGVALVYTIRNYRLTRRGQVTDRFTKALERLGSDQRYVRIGGVLALEQIVQDAPEQATHAAQVLGHFVRDRAPTSPGSTNARDGELTATDTSLPTSPEADVQVALTALTRPESRTHVDDLERLHLAILHLAGAVLVRADLTGAFLTKTNFIRADLSGADLTSAFLRRAAGGRACRPGTRARGGRTTIPHDRRRRPIAAALGTRHTTGARSARGRPPGAVAIVTRPPRPLNRIGAPAQRAPGRVERLLGQRCAQLAERPPRPHLSGSLVLRSLVQPSDRHCSHSPTGDEASGAPR
ncbi:pentapeptide repeat-containing protein [Streptomyces collinus]|uniref:pentapeptide repeat-containing protein n=1 Tax=Streptomyces collinus TaxID=42684 RepID=UPI0038086D28